MSKKTCVCDACGTQLVWRAKSFAWVHAKKGANHAPVPVEAR